MMRPSASDWGPLRRLPWSYFPKVQIHLGKELDQRLQGYIKLPIITLRCDLFDHLPWLTSHVFAERPKDEVLYPLLGLTETGTASYRS